MGKNPSGPPLSLHLTRAASQATSCPDFWVFQYILINLRQSLYFETLSVVCIADVMFQISPKIIRKPCRRINLIIMILDISFPQLDNFPYYLPLNFEK